MSAGAATTSFPHRHLLGIDGLSAAEISFLLDRSESYVAQNRAADKTRATLRGDLADRVLAATEYELAEQTRLRNTDDFKEGVKAMAERRLPIFNSR